MHMLRKAAVLVVALGTVGFLNVGAAQAHGGQDGGGQGGVFTVQQSTTCRSHDLNIDILGAVGLLNGVLGGALNGEGNPGAQEDHLGSTMGCNNAVGK
ncbi:MULTISPECIES: hypothetical protein [unclassified Streptomyces]|uniref:hypothetical protein n=1 Tax=unclassified Streptomyces TaxID=2593676 RepID=UPI00225413BF|nr:MULTISPECIES: hypothetical protein [unclassified Streptomyces]MCX5053462.1 hypothetical protein [Streptomyces sp. NBC_00474]MCX5059270.1 hypothetical protein [Streptomyces sp. NBC_00452]MCX5244085.1 hypothetical protein [Streptomyces sp. NBC_00201]MCX5290182.1 hypothetical protein [Streptomyces sp. NBC_00183]